MSYLSKPTYIIGHRNPDTDSICSAISYACLKQALGEQAIAVRAGKINAETKFVLERFGVSAPKLIPDLYPRVRDVMIESEIAVHPEDTLRDLGIVMKQHNSKSIPVIDDGRNLVGIVSVGDLAKLYFDELEMQDLSRAGVDFAGVLKVLDGELVCGQDLQRKVTGKVRIAAGSAVTIHNIINAGDVVLVSDRDNAQMACIGQDIACLVITANAAVDEAVLQEAAARGIIIIQAPYDTYTCARLINQSIPVGMIMQTKVVAFNPSDLVGDIKNTIANTKYRNYPVLEKGKLTGLINRDQLILPEREKIILVDHNERTQAIEGIEEAQIVEIVDHHRLGGMETSEPIFIHHEPVGSTATMIANMYWHHGVEMTQNIAGLLLSAILSDTVLFKSPTATTKDRDTAEKLACRTGISDIMKFGMAVLKAGSGLGDLTIPEMVRNDLKEFQVGEYHIAVGQVSVMDAAELLAMKDEIKADMESMRLKEQYDMILLMITDIIAEGTHLLYTGQPFALLRQAFGNPGNDSTFYLPGVMSRKKQVIPPMMEAARTQ